MWIVPDTRFEDLAKGPSEGTSELLEGLLPDLADNRNRWPLWTYDRTPRQPAEGGRLTWWGSRAWADRLHWSPSRLLADAGEQLRVQLSESVEGRIDWTPGTRHVYVELAQSPAAEEVFRRFGTNALFVRLPVSFELRAEAIRVQTARKPEQAGTASEIHQHAILMDEEETGELFRSLERELVRPPRATETAPWVASLSPTSYRSSAEPEINEEVGPTPYLSLLDRMLRHTWEGVDALTAESDDARDRLALEAFERVGLLPSRQGGSRYVISGEYLLQLVEEAGDIAEAVLNYAPAPDVLTAIRDVLAADKQEDLSLLEIERALRALPGRVTDLARQLRFPFMRQAELSTILQDTQASRRLARHLVMLRLPGLDPSQDDRLLEKNLSKARTARR